MHIARIIAPLPPDSKELTVSGDEHHYLANVLRLTSGQHLEVIDPNRSSAVAAKIGTIGKASTNLVVTNSLSLPTLPVRLTLVVGYPEYSSAQFIVEKSVELGVSTICFFRAQRSQTSPTTSRLTRLNRVLLSAIRQSGAHLPFPKVEFHNSLQDTLAHSSTNEPLRILCHPQPVHPGKHSYLLEFLQARQSLDNHLQPPLQSTDCYIVVGPEGGLTEEEVQLLLGANYHAVLLSKKTLRVETAAVSATALVLSAFSVY